MIVMVRSMKVSSTPVVPVVQHPSKSVMVKMMIVMGQSMKRFSTPVVLVGMFLI